MSVDEEVGKRLSDMEWGIDDFGDEILFVWSWPLVWSITGLFVLFSC